MEPVTLPITDCLDLHTFKAKEIASLIPEYLAACVDQNIFSVRLIHGKGKGILKKKVHQILRTCELVATFEMAPPEAGSWGATIVRLKKNKLTIENK